MGRILVLGNRRAMSRAEPAERSERPLGAAPGVRPESVTVPAMIWSCVEDPPPEVASAIARFRDLVGAVATAARTGPGGLERRLGERADRYAAIRGGVLAAWPKKLRSLDARRARTRVLCTLGRSASDHLRSAVWPALEDLADLASRSREPVSRNVSRACQVQLARFELALAAVVVLVEEPGPRSESGALAVAALAVQAGTLTRGLLECDDDPVA